ncbi:MAG: FAD binding domain-containing protein [Candidatus Marinimicrobia bacterium]|nr:FAD binding domain-containing protein [Candidatus Neomarinimicrobiota bacterium]
MVKGYRPGTLQEALELLAQETCTVMAGGTDLMVQRARGFSLRPKLDRPLVFIEQLKELKQIYKKDETLHIGPCVTLTDLLGHPHIPEIFKQMIGRMASPPTRNMATLGGNICNASPAGDTLPWFYAMNAKVKLQSSAAERTVPIDAFISGPKKTILGNNEILADIIIPDETFEINMYRKLGQRKGMSLTKASFLGLAMITGSTVTDIRIALGSVAPRIVRSPEIERTLKGKSINDIRSSAGEISQRYQPLITPIDDARSTAKYRKEASLNLIRHFLENMQP